ncbi:hypothetical protein Y032_0184g997 [Ancylostoma ceylanicum]|uniref:Secreted protein n=1 Tax=Ancylostoma ceylanicum TaxID=53326 RepID=A0A016SSE9_9BILA|nr:hypothetical protein Y032_0184g997 [Ancylostoma ceylanicum]
MYFTPLLLLVLVTLVSGGRFPHPPVFAAPQHYPSICYLPPAALSLRPFTTKTSQATDPTPTRNPAQIV